MKIVSLMEDTPGGNGCLFEHGFSLYVETKSHRILARSVLQIPRECQASWD